MNLNSNMHSQQGRWEQGRSPVGGDCYHTILNLISKIKFYIYYLLEVGAMAIAPYGFFVMPRLLNDALENGTLHRFYRRLLCY